MTLQLILEGVSDDNGASWAERHQSEVSSSSQSLTEATKDRSDDSRHRHIDAGNVSASIVAAKGALQRYLCL